MSDFAPNFTPRYRVRYSSLGKQHRATFRVARGVTDPSGIATKVAAIWDAFTTHIYADFTVLGADFALTDSDVFLPAVAPDFGGGSVSTSGINLAHAALAISMPGRSVNGLRAVNYLYGTDLSPDNGSALYNDFRITPAEIAVVGDLIAAMNELSPALVANDGATAVYYPYINVKTNDHWVRKLRQG